MNMISIGNRIMRVDYTNNSTSEIQPDQSATRSWEKNDGGFCQSLDDLFIFYGVKYKLTPSGSATDLRKIDATDGSSLQVITDFVEDDSITEMKVFPEGRMIILLIENNDDGIVRVYEYASGDGALSLKTLDPTGYMNVGCEYKSTQLLKAGSKFRLAMGCREDGRVFIEEFGIKVILPPCDPRCSTCTGPLASECTGC